MKITKKQFKVFRKEALRWLDRFGMKDWSVYFEQKELKGVRAECSFNCVGGIATLSLGTEWNELNDEFVTDKIIQRTAFHEVCELLLARLNDMTSQRFNLNEGDVEEEIHRIIRILENILWNKGKKI